MRGQKDSLEQRHFAAVSLTTLQEFWDCSMVSWDGKNANVPLTKSCVTQLCFFQFACMFWYGWDRAPNNINTTCLNMTVF